MPSIHNNGMLTSQFAAFTKLTLVNQFKNNHDEIPMRSQQSMDFEQFSEALKRNVVVAPELSRELPQSEQRDSDLNIRFGGNASYQHERLSFIKHAYQLGMVDENGVLLSLPNHNSLTQRNTVIQAYENGF